MSSNGDRLESIVKETIPGRRNEELKDVASTSAIVIDEFEAMTNNWFEIEKVHLYPNQIGITARFRWTIERWAGINMDTWLVKKGWNNDAHLMADWNGREENEMEARYSRNIVGVPVRANFLVLFTDRVFKAMQENRGTIIEDRKIEKEKMLKLIRQKRQERGGE